MAGTQQQLEELVLQCLSDALDEVDSPAGASLDSPILGQGSPLDSMAVVSMLVELESRLDEELGLEVSLTDERAMSQKNSPFRSVQTLIQYIGALPLEAGGV